MNIVVLAGGLSTERDVSLSSGDMVTRALRSRGHNVLLLDIFIGYGKETDGLDDIFNHTVECSIDVKGITDQAPTQDEIKEMRSDKSDCFFGPNVIRLCQYADFVFMGLHGEDGENGKVQAAFDLFGIQYTGTGYLGSALAMDKQISKMLFRMNDIPTPAGVTINKNRMNQIDISNIKIPCVVKPCSGGSSVGVSIVRSEEELLEAMQRAFQYENNIIIEDYIKGREFSVGVLNNEALPVIEISPLEGFYNYVNKYKAGNAVETCPALLDEKLTKQMQEHALSVVKVLGLGTYSRMDFLLSEENLIYCLEANTLPGMTETSLMPQEAQAMGIDFPELCEKIILLSMDYEDKQKG